AAWVVAGPLAAVEHEVDGGVRTRHDARSADTTVVGEILAAPGLVALVLMLRGLDHAAGRHVDLAARDAAAAGRRRAHAQERQPEADPDRGEALRLHRHERRTSQLRLVTTRPGDERRQSPTSGREGSALVAVGRMSYLTHRRIDAPRRLSRPPRLPP